MLCWDGTLDNSNLGQSIIVDPTDYLNTVLEAYADYIVWTRHIVTGDSTSGLFASISSSILPVMPCCPFFLLNLRRPPAT